MKMYNGKIFSHNINVNFMTYFVWIKLSHEIYICKPLLNSHELYMELNSHELHVNHFSQFNGKQEKQDILFFVFILCIRINCSFKSLNITNSIFSPYFIWYHLEKLIWEFFWGFFCCFHKALGNMNINLTKIQSSFHL